MRIVPRLFVAQVVTAGLLFLATISAGAETIVAPNSFATVEGTGTANSAPFNDTSRYQQIYAASQFGSTPILISQIAFRPTAGQGAFSHSLSELRVDLSTTSQSVGGLSSTFASNVGANDTTVFDSSIVLSSASTAGPGNTKNFDVVINLSTPFLYDPNAGNLLLDMRNFGTGFTGFLDLVQDPSMQLVFVDNSTSAPTGTVQPFGLVTQFTASPVPLPSTLVQAGLIVGVVGLRFAWRRRAKLI